MFAALIPWLILGAAFAVDAAAGTRNLQLHAIKDYAINTVAVCSVMHTVLPPFDWQPDFVVVGLKEFPSAQKVLLGSVNNRYYRLFVYVIGYVALNGRSTLWGKTIGMKNQINTAVERARTDFVSQSGGIQAHGG